MEKYNRAVEYRKIRNMQELRYHRRMLESRIDHQEIMVMYKLRCLWEFISPTNLMDMGFKAIAAHNPSFNILYKAVSFLRNLLNTRRGK